MLNRKQNASERINLQMIMELREKFEAADDDGNDGLDEVEVSFHMSKFFFLSSSLKILEKLLVQT